MALKQLKTQVYAPAAEKAKASEIPTLRVEGGDAKRFAELAAQLKVVEANKKALEAELKKLGSDEVIRLNSGAADVMTSSVRVIDDDGGVVTVTLKNAYSAMSVEAAEALFNELGVDPNDFVQQVMVPSFNTKIFYDKDGNFNEAVYRKVRANYVKLVNQLIDDGTLPADTVAMEEAKTVKVKDIFHQRRWALGLKANKTIHEHLPAQVAIRA